MVTLLAFAMVLVGIGIATALPHRALANDGASGGVVASAARAAIRATIRGQMEAFLVDDGALAFSYASPGIRRMFGTAESFMTMVQRGYEAVYRPRDVEFRDILMRDGRPVQRVFVVGPDNVPVTAEYSMERQPDGRWLIDGCSLTRAPEKLI